MPDPNCGLKSLALYLFAVFLCVCAMLFVVESIDPPEPVILMEKSQ